MKTNKNIEHDVGYLKRSHAQCFSITILLNAQFRSFIDRNREELNLTHNLTIHGLRHSNAALLLYAGEDIENISAHLGHASSDITSRVYAHMYAEVKIRMAKTVSNALFNRSNS